MQSRPKPQGDCAPKAGPQHVFKPYSTVCERCGASLLYAGLPDAPPCISDEHIAARRAVARLRSLGR